MSEADLAALGVLYRRIGDVAGVDALAAERGYRNRDEITVSPAAMGEAYEAKVRVFFEEHLHEDEEIRYVRAGKGYFDVRDREDRWVRIEMEKVRGLFVFFFFPFPPLGFFFFFLFISYFLFLLLQLMMMLCKEAIIGGWLTVDGQDDLIILPAGIYHRFTTDESNVGAETKVSSGGELGC